LEQIVGDGPQPRKHVVSLDSLSLSLVQYRTGKQRETATPAIGLESRPKASIAYVVFLDADKHRVRPDGRNVSFEMEFRSKRKGKLRLDAGQQREGVYKLKLPGNRPSKPCKMHLFVRIDNGTEVAEEWLDDWLRLC